MGQNISACDTQGFGKSPNEAIAAMNSNLMFRYGTETKLDRDTQKLSIRTKNNKIYSVAITAPQNGIYMAYLQLDD